MSNYYLNDLLIATGNQGKYREYQKFLEDLAIPLKSLSGLSIEEPEETECDFVGNALLKARYYYKHTGVSCLSDDSGLCIDALDGMPGIYSARWAGSGKDFAVAMQKVYDQLQAQGVVPEEDVLPAYFICVIALKLNDKDEFTFEGRINGHIKFPIKGIAGFGYDPIFCPVGYDVRFSEMEAKEKAKISHRSIAVKKLLEFVKLNVAL